MKGLVLIPCTNRPGFLELTLERISLARGFKNYAYLFSIDRGYKHNDGVINAWGKKFQAAIEVVNRGKHSYTGNVYNFMNAFKEAYSMTHPGQYVHVIEDDIFISDGYFEFHEAVWDHAGGGKKIGRGGQKIFAISACRNQNSRATPDGPAGGYYLHNSYQSLGVSFPRESLEYIIPHCTPAYWKTMFEYLQQKFPHSGIPNIHAEQAGLIHRIIKSNGFYTAYPAHPFAFHAGFAGANRKSLRHPSEYSAHEIRSMAAEQMNAEAVNYRDITPCEMSGRKFLKPEFLGIAG